MLAGSLAVINPKENAGPVAAGIRCSVACAFCILPTPSNRLPSQSIDHGRPLTMMSMLDVSFKITIKYTPGPYW